MSIFRKYCVPCDNAGCGRCINWSCNNEVEVDFDFDDYDSHILHDEDDLCHDCHSTDCFCGETDELNLDDFCHDCCSTDCFCGEIDEHNFNNYDSHILLVEDDESREQKELDEKQKELDESFNSFEQDKINKSKEFFKSFEETMDYHLWIHQQIELYKDNSEFQYNLLLCTGINIMPK